MEECPSYTILEQGVEMMDANCELEKGHEGKHHARVKVRGDNDIRLEWE